MKLVIKSGLVALALSAIACDDGSTKDPSTTPRSELNPPTALTTVTWDKKIELRWQAANAEEAFKGYHVFAVADKPISGLTAPAYPKNLVPAVTLASGSIPRCLDNSTIFEAFGFAATDRECEGDAEAASDSGTTDSALLADEEAPEKIENIVMCDEHNDATISYPATSPNLGEMKCTVSKLANGDALANGTTYTFFVVSVAGDEKNNISWTSNFVEDTPAVGLFDGELTVDATKVYRFDLANITGFTAYTAAPAAMTELCTNAIFNDTVVGSGSQVCSINRSNQQTTGGIYIGRLGTGDFPQRTFISVPKDGAIKLQLRGPQVLDTDGSVQKSIPGDAAVDATYLSAGRLYPIYGLQIFDMEVTVGSTKHYGKIWIGQPTLTAGTTPAATDPMTIPVKIVMQTKALSHHYLTRPSSEF